MRRINSTWYCPSMSTPWRRTLRITRRTLGYGFLILLIAAALLVSVANLMLPYVGNNPERLQTWLSERVGQPVKFSQSETEWTRRGPRIRLSQLKVGEGDAAVEIARAELLVSVYSGLFPNHPLTELKAKDLHLRLVQNPDDSWLLLGVPRQKDSTTDALDVLSGFGELQIERSDLIVEPLKHAAIKIPRIDMRMQVKGNRLQIGLRAEALRGDTPLQLVADLDRRDMSGKLWLGGEDLHARHWLALFPGLKVPPVQSSSRLAIWASIERRRLMRLRGTLALKDLEIVPDKPSIFPFSRNQVLYDNIDAQWLWQRKGQKMQLSIPSVQFRNGKSTMRVEGVHAVSDGTYWQAKIARADLNPITVLIPLAKGELPAVEDWLSQAAITGAIKDLQAYGTRDLQKWRVAGRASNLAMHPIGSAPGFQQLGGSFVTDQNGGVMRFGQGDVVLDWPISFGRNVRSRFDGSVAWWRAGPDWVLGAKNLHWQGEGMALTLNTQMHFAAGREAPLLNLSARLAPFDFATAKRFWLRHLMPKASIDWLDMALVKGQVRDGAILISGDLADWPFANKAGRFSATATVLADEMKFAADWPAAENARLNVDFNGPGFTATGNARFLGNAVTVKPSGIAVFTDSKLTIDVHTDSNFKRLQPVLAKTPLKDKVGGVVTRLSGSGPVSADVQMLFPLKQGVQFNRIAGDIAFKNTAMASAEWKLALQNAQGRARFDNDGFIASGLRAQMARNPVVLDLRIGKPHVTDARNQLEARLQGAFTADYLLAFDPSLQDLKSVMKGKSQWQFGVTAPQGVALENAPILLTAQSDLLGTRIDLPAPVYKPASLPQPFLFKTALPVEKGTIEFRMEPTLRLLLKKPKDGPMSGIALLGAQAQGALPAKGFTVIGQAETLDAPAWMALAKKAEGEVGLQKFDVRVAHLPLLGQDFGETRLQLLPSPALMTVLASGTRLDGSIRMPEAANEPIAGNFTRVHLLPAVAAAETGERAAPQTSIDFGNPAGLPPVRIRIDSLRYAGLDMGRADVQTQPNAQGMQIQKFATQSPLLAINASGLWQGTGAQASTVISADINAPDVGKVLTALQYKGVINRGVAKTQLTGAWKGTPSDFSLVAFKGQMTMDIRDGQILEVDPGGGRVLGLLSIAELPRRLSLDFRDFFNKGLAFSSIKAQIKFEQGMATTQDTRIDAPAADIRISGSTDLVNERFDQRVTVQPKAGTLLPILGAATAGPLGAAAGVVAQAVLNKPLKESSETVYRITGPWAKPTVEKLPDKKK